MTGLTPQNSQLLVVRRQGSSSSRKQSRYKSGAALELGILRARARGFDTFWVFGPEVDGKRPLLRQWSDRDVSRSTCRFCRRAITHGGTAGLAAAPHWFDDDDDFSCPDGEHEHQPEGVDP